MVNSNPTPQIVLDGSPSFSRWLRELRQSGELFVFLALRDVLLRYKQAVFGVAWALLKPLTTAAIFTAVFSQVLQLQTGNTPYVLFALSGMIVWQFISGSASDASVSLIANVSLVTKVYFPRILVPSACLVVNGIDALVGSLFLLILWVILGIPAVGSLWLLPLVFVWAVSLALGLGAWLSAMTVRYRDTKFIVPFALQLGLYASPVAYPLKTLPESLIKWAYLNPVTGLIELFRQALFGTPLSWAPGVFVSLAISFLLVISGVYFFRRLEGSFADVI